MLKRLTLWRAQKYVYDFVAPLNFPEIVFLQINAHLLLLPTV